MTVRFSAERLLLQPADGEEVLIDDGDRAVPVKPKPEPIKRPPDVPPFSVMRLIQDGEVASSLHPDEGEQGAGVEARVHDWIARHGAPERLDVDVDASSITDDDLGPLLLVGRRHGIPITVNLRPRG